MQELDDIALLRQYVDDNSEEAFATLVTRHINKVYSVALRHTGNPHQAEEITQAVFVILARKSGRLGRRVILSGWLYQTARLTAVTFIRSAIRRARREQEAHMQSVLNESESDVWKQIAPLLDAAMAGLNETDRHAVVLRFFDGKSMGEIGAAMGANEDAARQRVGRALEKLQKYFARHGVHSTTETIAQAISTHSVQAAPVLLAKSVTAVALAKGAAVSTSTLTLVKATLIAMKTKTTVATIATAAAIMLGTGTYVVYHLETAHAPSTPGDTVPIKLSDTVPIKFANDDFKDPASNLAAALLSGGNNNSDKFLNEIDPDTRRTTNSAPAGHIKCLVAPTSTGSADYLKSLPSAFEKGLATSRSIRYFIDKNSSLFGKRIRISGWMKASDVRNWAGAAMVVMNVGGYIFAYDGMYDRPIHGTTGWQQVEFVTDIPKEPCLIYLAPTLYGTGEFWCDDFQIDVVPADTPITDDRVWNVWSQDPNDYSETTDYKVTHNGHPALCIAYVSPETPQKYSFVWWGQHNREPEKFQKYLGHTVRMTIWAKSENIPGNAGLNFEPKGAGGQTLAKHSAFGRTQIRGTTDWAQHSVTCVIPEDTQDFQTAFFIFGGGKLWIDMDSFKCEIVK
jgi:RNA polymerase sigma factor (sigma-70 family)